MHWLQKLVSRFANAAHGRSASLARSRSSRRSWRPELGVLEDRTVPTTLSSITSNFNGTAIPAGDTLWFNGAFKASNVPAAPATLYLTDQAITFTAAGTSYTVDVPDSVITLSPATTTATTSFDTAANAWITNLPSSWSGNAFLGGAAYYLPAGLPGGIKNVTWSANFATDSPGIKLNWQWATAVYTNFSADYNALNVKPLDGAGSVTVYGNSHHAGTPEAFTSFVVGGARGGGGSNFTGSYSSTKSVIPDRYVPPVPALASVSGHVYRDVDGDGVRDAVDEDLFGVTITLFNSNGDTVAQTTTDENGFYSFSDLAAGDYTIVETQPQDYDQGTNNVGSLGGLVVDDSFFITLHAGDVGVGYNFGEVFGAPPA